MSGHADTILRDQLERVGYFSVDADESERFIAALDVLVAENQQLAEQATVWQKGLSLERAENQRLREALERVIAIARQKHIGAPYLEAERIARAALDGTDDGPPRAENREAVQPSEDA